MWELILFSIIIGYIWGWMFSALYYYLKYDDWSLFVIKTFGYPYWVWKAFIEFIKDLRTK